MTHLELAVYRLGMTKTRDHAEMEKRRKKAATLFNKGYPAPEVARRFGVAGQVAYRWKRAWAQGGKGALASKGPAGRKTKLDRETNSAGHGGAAGRPGGPGIQDGPVDFAACGRAD